MHDDSSNRNIFRVTGHLCGGIHWSPVNSPHKGRWHGAVMFTLICARINGWVNNCEAGDLRRHHGHYDVIVMVCTHVQRIENWYMGTLCWGNVSCSQKRLPSFQKKNVSIRPVLYWEFRFDEDDVPLEPNSLGPGKRHTFVSLKLQCALHISWSYFFKDLTKDTP